MKHKHAEVIKQWADGAAIEYRNSVIDGRWYDDAGNPSWYGHYEYRVKPEPDYPVTSLDGELLKAKFYDVYDNVEQGLVRIANAAIKQAIIDGSVVLPSNANK